MNEVAIKNKMMIFREVWNVFFLLNCLFSRGGPIVS